MKCPYAVNRQVTTQTVIEYNAEGNQDGYTEVQTNLTVFIDCLQEECGAWKHGQCKYKD